VRHEAGGPSRLVGAVDVGATKTLIAVRRLPLEEWTAGDRTVRIATPPEPAALVEAIATTIDALAIEAGGTVVAVGIGSPGPVDAGRGIVVHSPNLGWRDVPLAAFVAERVDARVALDDDANVGALGEAMLGAGRGADPVAYLTVSTGIGAGIVIGDRVLRGAHGTAGEVGHLVVDPAGPRCGCGRRGCVEAFAGGRGLERRARAELRGRARPDGTPVPWRAADVFRAARAGDVDAARLVADGEAALARGLAALITAVDPERIVVGGSLALAHRGYIGRAARAARHLTIEGTGGRPTFCAPALGAESVLAGAAALGAALVADDGHPPPGR
jgi:glucokinase